MGDALLPLFSSSSVCYSPPLLSARLLYPPFSFPLLPYLPKFSGVWVEFQPQTHFGTFWANNCDRRPQFWLLIIMQHWWQFCCAEVDTDEKVIVIPFSAARPLGFCQLPVHDPRSCVWDVLAVVAVILLTLLTFDVCLYVGYVHSWSGTEGQGHTSVIGQGQRSLLPCQHHACSCVWCIFTPVSYTHLTLPTKRIV